MTITQSAGGLTATDNYGPNGGVGAFYDPQAFRIARVVQQTQRDWNEETAGYHPQIFGACVSVRSTSADDVTIGADAAKFTASRVVDKSSTLASVWVVDTDTDEGELIGGNSDRVPDGGPQAPRVVRVEFEIKGDSFGPAADEIDIHGFIIGDDNQSPMPTGETAPAFEMQAFPIGTSGEITIYDENMPCSAYLMQQAVCNNANAIGYKTLDVVTFPIVGIGSVV